MPLATLPFHFCPALKRVSSAPFRWATGLVVILGLTIPGEAQAWDHHRHAHPSSYEVIKSVNEAKQTVNVGHEHGKDHSEKAIAVNGFTEITVDGQKAKLRDLKPGMMVQVDLESDNVAAGLDATHVNKK